MIIIGDNMKRLFMLLIILFCLFLGVQFCFNYFGKGGTSNYRIDGFDVKEVFTQNRKNEFDNYYIEISKDDTVFSIQLFDNFNKSNKIIKEIEYFKDDQYECIFPVFKGTKQYTDLICKSDVYYNYQEIKNKDNKLDEFVSGLKNYNEDNLIDKKDYKEAKGYKLYNNLPDNHYLALDSYQGIVLYNNNAMEYIKLFDRDIYERKISSSISKNYIVADYNEEYDFHKFKIVNLENGSIKEVVSDKSISFDSYIQGSIGDELYLFDKSNKKQYEIDLKGKTVIEIGNESSGVKVYQNNEWQNSNVYEASSNDLVFNTYKGELNINGIAYDKVDKIGNALSGYYYMYKKVNGRYEVYRANVQNTSNITYLFDTDNISYAIYDKDYVYYKDGKYIKCYSSKFGVRTIAENNELAFNNNLKMYLYVK